MDQFHNPNSSAGPYSVVWDTTTSVPGSSTTGNHPLQPGFIQLQ